MSISSYVLVIFFAPFAFLQSTEGDQSANNTQQTISFNDLFVVTGTNNRIRAEKKCGNFAKVYFDDAKLKLFSGEILSFAPGSREEALVNRNPFALQCNFDTFRPGFLFKPFRLSPNAPCSTGCFRYSYFVADATRSLVILINVLIEDARSRSTGVVGGSGGRQPIAATITIETTSDSRREAITRAVQQLRNNRSFSDIFIDQNATVVRRLGPRRYRVILKFNEFIL